MKKPEFHWKTKPFRKPGKKAVLFLAAAAVVVAAGCGIWYAASGTGGDPVYVYPFSYIGMTEYWGDSQESYGPVTTDNIQTVFLTDTQTVTEIAVEPGDQVKKGDLLLSFDTTLSDLELERKRLAVEKLKLQLIEAQETLKEINGMKPMAPGGGYEEEDNEFDDGGAYLGEALVGAKQFSSDKRYDGSAPEKALICWIGTNTSIDQDLLGQIYEKAAEYQNIFLPDLPESDGETDGEETPGTGIAPDTDSGMDPDLDNDYDDSGSGSAGNEAGGSNPDYDNDSDSDNDTDSDNDADSGTDTADLTEADNDSDSQENTAASAVRTQINCYVVLKMTDGDRALSDKTLWQGLKITSNGSGYSFRFVETVIEDHMIAHLTLEEESSVQMPDMGSGMTAAQIAEMRAEQQKKIKDLQLQIKMAEAEYKIMLKEVNDGNIYAEIDGEVVSLLTEEEAKTQQQPIVKVSDGGGFYVEGFVSELEKDAMVLGQEVTVNDWNTGMIYTGTVKSVGDFPTAEGYWNGMGNPTASFYPFRVFVDGSADLQAGSYVSVMYASSQGENGIYLENPFLRTEKGESYVYVLDSSGRLEKRNVTIGKSLWGSYTQILEGLTEEDLIAFPYGKNVKPGVKAVEGDMSNLYG